MNERESWLTALGEGEIHAALAPVFAALPPEIALEALVVHRPAGAAASKAVEAAILTPALKGNTAVASALWLYVDELDLSHTLSQALHSPTGSYLHGIMHRREGDFGNSLYWMSQTGSHPVWGQIPNFNPRGFIRAVEARSSGDNDDLVALQRMEWNTLFHHILRYGAQ
ncbi:MAG: hypothetical protein GC168_13395 [Candidatus Hydrogenedens sp.]|nr:hypothetical protein [Candidatus Hydrogenedens sp.]